MVLFPVQVPGRSTGEPRRTPLNEPPHVSLRAQYGYMGIYVGRCCRENIVLLGSHVLALHNAVKFNWASSHWKLVPLNLPLLDSGARDTQAEKNTFLFQLSIKTLPVSSGFTSILPITTPLFSIFREESCDYL
jgi:hypothetical protein